MDFCLRYLSVFGILFIRKSELRQAVYLLQSSNIAEEVRPPSFIFTKEGDAYVRKTRS